MEQKYLSLEKAIALIPKSARIFVHGGAATPLALLRELVRQGEGFQNATLYHLHTEGELNYRLPKYQKNFRVVNLFVGSNIRQSLDYDRIDFVPCFLSEIPQMFRSREMALDVALLHVSPPDKFGYCSLGVSVDVAKSAFDSAAIVIAQVNPRMPRIHGEGMIHQDHFTALVAVDEPLYESTPKAPDEEEKNIAQHVAGLIEDGSTLQLGIGAIPNAVAQALVHHKNLGLHTEMWSDGALGLVECGALNNSQKNIHRGKILSSFVIGSRKLYDFVDDNPSVIQLGADYVNAPNTIARNPKVVAVNSAVEVDLTGQVCADSVGPRIISGIGGQMDFMRGAALSQGGKPIIALKSRTAKGVSKLVSHLKTGAGVVTTRAHVHYVVTEFGVANLHGKTIRERAQALMGLAHPEDRENLDRDFFKMLKGMER